MIELFEQQHFSRNFNPRIQVWYFSSQALHFIFKSALNPHLTFPVKTQETQKPATIFSTEWTSIPAPKYCNQQPDHKRL